MENSRYKKLIDHVILEQLGKGKTFTFTVTGNSMHPLIREGDPIQIEQCKPRDLSMGDIITFRNDDLTVTHRVLWIMRRRDGITLLTKGDNEINVDPPVSPGHILGKVAAVERGDRILNLESPPWRFINRLLGILQLMETLFILGYRFGAERLGSFKPSLLAKVKPSRFYLRLKNRGLGFAARIIM